MTRNDIKELSIQFNLNGLSFCILNRSLNTIEFLKSIDFEQKLTPNDALNRLKSELSANTVFSDTFDAVTVIHQNELASLVPKDLYDENHKADYLKFNSKILRTDLISTDDVSINNSVNVFVPYVNVNNYILDIFGEFVYKHSSTLLIDASLQTKNSSDKPEVYLNVNSASLELLVVERGELLLFNVFQYSTKEDLIYYVLFVFEQLKLDAETTQLNLTGTVNKEDEIFNILFTYIRHVKMLKNNYTFNFSKALDIESLHHHYLILNSF
ncbi:DUF3822 family protein [Winogradskyella ursingii]|uniref:DUF3822 family protein n=1 Tax=Winogradskyella ursingii TaxID=2686079 RepID=UPI0015C86CE9|nr:DUF3822 family protein [Winogradskyella ursingii]